MTKLLAASSFGGCCVSRQSNRSKPDRIGIGVIKL